MPRIQENPDVTSAFSWITPLLSSFAPFHGHFLVRLADHLRVPRSSGRSFSPRPGGTCRSDSSVLIRVNPWLLSAPVSVDRCSDLSALRFGSLCSAVARNSVACLVMACVNSLLARPCLFCCRPTSSSAWEFPNPCRSFAPTSHLLRSDAAQRIACSPQDFPTKNDCLLRE
jgi:hypothetical protein